MKAIIRVSLAALLLAGAYSAFSADCPRPGPLVPVPGIPAPAPR